MRERHDLGGPRPKPSPPRALSVAACRARTTIIGCCMTIIGCWMNMHGPTHMRPQPQPPPIIIPPPIIPPIIMPPPIPMQGPTQPRPQPHIMLFRMAPSTASSAISMPRPNMAAWMGRHTRGIG